MIKAKIYKKQEEDRKKKEKGMAISSSTERAGNGTVKPTRTEIKNSLASIPSFDGALGKGLTIDKNGVVDSKAVVRIIKDGKPVTIK